MDTQPYGSVETLIANLNAARAASSNPSGRAMTLSTRAGIIATIDEEDQWATGLAWHAHTSGRNRYLCRSYGPDLHVSFHAHILPTWRRSTLVDVAHIDGDSLNNRRSNLAYVMHSTNVAKGRRKPR